MKLTRIFSQPIRKQLAWLLPLLLLCQCNIPRDPDDTLEKVRNGVLRVGISEHMPWTSFDNGRPAGVEVALVQELAQALNAQVEWEPGSEFHLVEALKHGELDLVIGGITKKTVWQKEAGMTKPYYEAVLTIGGAPGQAPPAPLKDVPVGVAKRTKAVKYVRDENARPVPLQDVDAYAGPVAAFSYELDYWGRTASDKKLLLEKHVLLLPRGENAWLRYVERFLDKKKPHIHQMLVKELSRPHEKNP